MADTTDLNITGNRIIQTVEGVEMNAGTVKLDATIRNGKIYIKFAYYTLNGSRPLKPVSVDARHLVSDLVSAKSIDQYLDDAVIYLNMHLGVGAVERLNT